MLTPRTDGRVESLVAVLLPIMTPRLQGELHADGRMELALWGAGDLGRLRFTPIAGPYVHAPNLVTTPSGGAYAAQSDPVLVLKGAAYRGFTPARKCARWDRTATQLQRGGSRQAPQSFVITHACAGSSQSPTPVSHV